MEEQMEEEHHSVSPGVDAPPDRRKTAWIGMGALLVALVLLAFLSGPSGFDPDAPPPAADGRLATATDAHPDDEKSTGKMAPLM